MGTRGGSPGFKSIEARGYCAFATQTGSVGIGVVDPVSKLEVEGGTNAIITMNSTSGTGGRMDFAHGGTNYGNIGSGRNQR